MASNTSEDLRYKNKEWLQEEYIEKDRTQKSIAEECGVSGTTVSYWCEKFDLRKPETAYFGVQTDGYEQWRDGAGEGSTDSVLVHRLLATLKVDDLDELGGKVIHHENGVQRDNRLENIRAVSREEHQEIHAEQSA